MELVAPTFNETMATPATTLLKRLCFLKRLLHGVSPARMAKRMHVKICTSVSPMWMVACAACVTPLRMVTCTACVSPVSMATCTACVSPVRLATCTHCFVHVNPALTLLMATCVHCFTSRNDEIRVSSCFSTKSLHKTDPQ